MVLCGNFTSRSISQGNARDIQRYQGALYILFFCFGRDELFGFFVRREL